MAAATRLMARLRRLPVLFVAAAVLIVGTAASFHAPAFAQEEEARPWSLRDLFFPRRSERVAPPPDARFPPRPKKKKAVVRKPPAAPQAPVVEKAADARTILVIGDFMASGLAEGLNEVFADNPAIRVADKARGSSGFVRDDVYDWPQEIAGVLAAEKPAAVIVMMGSNDRQQMKVGEEREQPRTEVWTKAYELRTEALAKALASSKIPYLWVGMPAFKTQKMTTDMLAFNGIYRAAAETYNGEFVDIWDGFVDENGAFVSTGPDVNGQPVRLRADDGINLTRGGKRKLAFYAEKPLMKMLGLSTPTAPASLPAGPMSSGQPATPAAPMPVDRTEPIALGDPALDGGTELLGATPPAKPALVLPGEKLAVQGIAPAASPGRADDFGGSTASVPPRETTNAIKRNSE
ncbi:DUF459 domain-containing protein [Mesorhizobium sp. 1M-11]|uniref:SGNH/GDSL hydrolase family protein n=1 Tax=Mesorhizobium sp. 1M-11 TaxID=1529006 RepID=UPI0006C75F72|nr:DUF459 domain-containing protein [Mesorhizobium sp. 1M-11]